MNGIRLHAVQAGPVDGPLVLLLHGFPEFWRGWINQIEPLARAGWRVVAPDQRGYNLSDKPAGVSSYRMSELVGDVTGLVQALGRQKACLVGHDWGAGVTWETAIRRPDCVQKLVILNAPHPDVMTRFLLSRLRQLLKSWYIFFFQVPGLPEAMLRLNDWQPAVQMLQRSRQPGAFLPEQIEHYRRAWWQKDAMTNMINWYRAAFRRALRGPWNPRQIQPRRVKPPALILWGEQDIALSKEMVQPSLDLCDQGRLVTFPHATHWVQHDEAVEVTRQLLAFLAER